MAKRKVQARSPYARKNKVPFTYTNRKCEHNNTHLQKVAGVEYLICNACQTIRDNELNAKLANRVFVLPNPSVLEGLAEAA